MIADSRTHFDARIRALGRKHRALAKGSTVKMRRDGLIVVRPSRKSSGSSWFPARGLAVLLILLFALKGGLLLALEPAEYQTRLDRLASGTGLERVGATLMQPDRVSVMFAEAYRAAFEALQ